jgi:hypothetical protein
MNGIVPPSAPPGYHPEVEADFREIKPAPEASFLGRAWARVKGVARWVNDKAIHPVIGACTHVLDYAIYGAWVAYSYTLQPVLVFMERWVPGMSRLRNAIRTYMAVSTVIGAVIGLSIAVSAGASPFVVLGMMVLGAVLMPWIMLTTPAIWGLIALDIWFLSSVIILIDTTFDKWFDPRVSFWQLLGYRACPGLFEYAMGLNPETGELVHEACPA